MREHTLMTRLWFVAALALTMGLQRATAGDPTPSDDEFPGNQYVKVRLALEETSLMPGKGGHLAVIFDIAKGWHLYWRNSGDSGLPPKVNLKVPEGAAVGAAQWPVPTRYVQPGDLVDYTFEDQLVLIYPLTLSDHFNIRDKFSIEAEIDWLVCKDRCVPGQARLKTEFPVGAFSRPSAEAGLFAKTRERHPAPPFSSRTQQELKWEGHDLVIKLKGAKRLTFFPYENDESVYPKDLYSRGEVKSDTLRLTYPDDVRKLNQVGGVLSADLDGKVLSCEVRTRPPQDGAKSTK